MCVLCEKVKRNSQGYNYCPYCGTSFYPNGFRSIYSFNVKYSCDNLGRRIGLPTITTIDLRKDK